VAEKVLDNHPAGEVVRDFLKSGVGHNGRKSRVGALQIHQLQHLVDHAIRVVGYDASGHIGKPVCVGLRLYGRKTTRTEREDR
jgi:hypothetical protein